MTLMDRRRALMGENPWKEVPFDKTQFNLSNNSVTCTYNAQTDTISIAMKSAGQYKASDAPFFTEEGYEYLIVSDYNTTAGVAKLCVRNSGHGVLKSTSTINAPASGNFRVIISHRSDIAMISLFSSWSSSEKGNTSYSGLRIYRREA